MVIAARADELHQHFPSMKSALHFASPDKKMRAKLLGLFFCFARQATCKRARPYRRRRRAGPRIATAKFVTDIPMKKSHRSWTTLDNVEKGLSKITCPKLVLWGRKDFCFNDYFLNRWKDIYPEAKFKVFEEAGHYVIEDAGEEIIKEMRAFI